MNEWSTTSVVAAAAVAVVVVLLVALVVVMAGNRRTRAELAETRRAQAELLEKVEAMARPEPAARPGAEVAEFVITDVGREAEASGARETGQSPVAGRIEGRLFVDIVARETVVKAASWSYGLRRALSAENRNRLRFEVRRETKRATRQRKADVKEALRQYYERQKGDVG